MSGAYKSMLSDVGALELSGWAHNNLNPTIHWDKISHDAHEMKSAISQVQDAYIHKEEHLKQMVDRFCKQVGDNGLLCPRDRIRHSNDNHPVVGFQQSLPSGIISEKLRKKLGLEDMSRAYDKCRQQHPSDLEGCVRGQASKFLSASADTSCHVNKRTYNADISGKYSNMRSGTPLACNETPLANFYVLSKEQSAELGKELQDVVEEQIEQSEGNEGYLMEGTPKMTAGKLFGQNYGKYQ